MATAIWNEKEGRWIIRLSINGKRKKFTSSTPGAAGKRDVMRRYREYMETGVSRGAPTVRDMWPEFLDDVAARSTKQSVNDESHGRLYILPKVGGRKINTMTPHDWQKVINTATGQNGRPLAEKTIKNIKGTITSFVAFCYRAGLVASKETGLYIPVGHPVGEKEILQPDEVRRLFSDEFSSNWFINLFRLLVVTGLRPGEGLGLQWSDLSGDSFRINRSIDAHGDITPGKNKNARRVVPLTAATRQLFADQKERTAHLGSEWVFCNQLGAKPTQSLTKKYFNRLRQALGRPGITPYGLRHTLASLLKYSMPEQMIKNLLGHSSTMPTFEVYGHELDTDQAAMAQALESALASTVGPISRPGVSGDNLPGNNSGAIITQLRAN